MTSELNKILKQIPKLMIGFFVIATGIVFMLQANLGMNPWGTLHMGIVNQIGITFGRASQLTGLIIIVLSLFIRVYPGVATILNMYFIGFFVDMIKGSGYIPVFDHLGLQVIELLLGLFFFSYGLYIYLSCGLGAGPRDGLMVGLIRITGLSATYIKPALEITVIAMGFLLGGKVGIGTAVVAILGGYILDGIFHFHQFDPKSKRQLNLYDHYKSLNQKA